MKGTARPHLTLTDYKQIIGCQCRQEMGEIPNFTDSERFKTPKSDFTKTKSFISLDSRFVELKNTEERATLSNP